MYKVEINNNGDSVMKVKSEDGEFAIDTEGKGISPSSALLASLGSCIGVYIQKYAKGTNIELKGFRVNVNAEFSKEKPICFKTINVSFSLKDTVINEKKMKALLRFVHNCPVHNTLNIPTEVKIAFS